MNDHAKCAECGQVIHRAGAFGWLHDATGRRRCDLPRYVDARPEDGQS